MDEQHMPIDIQLRKLLDWLISRRICNRQWHENIVAIREKIGHAIRDMPEHEEIKNLLSGANINYFHCLKIVEILKETEKDTRNFLGSYGSQRMKDWQEVVKLYQKENIFLAESAQLLSQAVIYEIPGLKKSLSKSIQTQEECDKKEKDNIRKANDIRNEYEKACRDLGIKGVTIRKEIISLLDDLPNTYADIAKDVQQLKKYLQIYKEFLQSSLDEAMYNEKDILSTLTLLIDRGNITTYEWIHGEAPLTIEENKLVFEDEDENINSDDKIDFGDDDEAIDFSAVGEVDLDSGADIDWGNLDTLEEGEIVDDLDWSITQEDNDAVVDIVIEDGGLSGGVAKDSEALSILDNRKTRTLIIDELTELSCFLEQRQVELQAEDEGRFTLSTSSIKKGDLSTLIQGIEVIKLIMSRLNTGKIHHLQLIRDSPKYVDRLVDSLKLKLSMEAKLKSSVIGIQEKREEALLNQADAQKRLDIIKNKTKILQRDIEKDISGRYKNRPVNIMGGIQSV